MTKGQRETVAAPCRMLFNAARGAVIGSKKLATRSVYSNAKTGE